MYEAAADPYCYRGTSVLKNRLNLRTQAELRSFEAFITAQRTDEPLPSGDLGVRHYLAIHRHLFQDVYKWAGRIRTVRLAKDGSSFCYPENIDREMHRLFDNLAEENHFRDLLREAFAAKAAHFLSELNAIHPFREGNGRTQNIFLVILANRAGHPLDLERIDPPAFLAAMIASFHGEEQRLTEAIQSLIRGAS